VIVAAVFCLAAAASPALARAPEIKSTVSIGPADGHGQDFTLAGIVESARSKCLKGRTVVVKFHYVAGATQTIDTAYTSVRGAWGAHVRQDEFQGATEAIATLKRESFAHGAPCSGDTARRMFA
jgi:hypothetical protein